MAISSTSTGMRQVGTEPTTGRPIIIETAVVHYPDGDVTVAALNRNNNNAKAGGWAPYNLGNGVGWARAVSAARLRGQLASGDVLFHLVGNQGTNPKTGDPWVAGWYAHAPAGVGAQELAAFQSATNNLAANVNQGAQQNQMPAPMSTPTGQPVQVPNGAQMMPMQQPPPPAPSRLPLLLGLGVLALGAYLILD
jgi:hypothetical protein